MDLSMTPGKLAIIVGGAGFLGMVVSKEGLMANMSDVVTCAKNILERIRIKTDYSLSWVRTEKTFHFFPMNWEEQVPRDLLELKVKELIQELQQLAASDEVKELRQELQQLAASDRRRRLETIMTTTNDSRGGKYGTIVIVFVVVGYGYVWWKGWKLVDMMLATKRSLSDAKTAVSKQLENFFSSVPATKRSLSSTTTDSVNSSFDDEVPEITASSLQEEEVSFQVPEK